MFQFNIMCMPFNPMFQLNKCYANLHSLSDFLRTPFAFWLPTHFLCMPFNPIPLNFKYVFTGVDRSPCHSSGRGVFRSNMTWMTFDWHFNAYHAYDNHYKSLKHAYTRTHTHIHTHMHMHTHTHTHTFTCQHAHTHTHSLATAHTHTNSHPHTRIPTHSVSVRYTHTHT